MIKIKQKIMMLLLCISIVLMGVPVYANGFTISVGAIVATNDTVDVPITISGNTGLCGATIKVVYDSAPKLNNITSGEALSNLTLTKPGNMDSNPFVLVWDGMEADSSNGVIAILSFAKPKLPGKYNVSVSFDDGDLVDGNLTPIFAEVKNGSVDVPESVQPTTTPTAAPDDSDVGDEVITVSTVTMQPGETVDVYLNLDGKADICGATLKVEYDRTLKLVGINQGGALSSLNMTKPGNLLSNPFTLVWDGMEPDSTKGIIATLRFTAPLEIGTYNISVSYEKGDIVDGALKPVAVIVVNGGIKVENNIYETIEPITQTTLKNLTSSYKFSITSDIELNEEKVIVAVYDSFDRLLTSKLTSFDGDTEGYISFAKNSEMKYAKVFVWDDAFQPLGGSETIVIVQ